MKIILNFVEDELDFLLRGGGVVSQLTGRVSCPWGEKGNLSSTNTKLKHKKFKQIKKKTCKCKRLVNYTYV